MEYTKLGTTGTEVSQLCFGTWRFGKETDGVVETTRDEAHELLDTCWDLGINYIDTANVYGDPQGTSEKYIGEWLEDHDRQDFVIASKVYSDMGDRPNDSGLGRKHIREQIDATLERLGTDYLDVYYIHRWDEETPIEETLATLNELVKEGKVNHLGASMMSTWKLTTALWESDVNGWERFEVTQPRFNPAYRDDAPFRQTPEYPVHVSHYLEFCTEQGLAVCPYSPLEGGFLTGKYERDGDNPSGSRGDLEFWIDHFGDREWSVLDEIRSVAEELDATPAQVSLAWMLRQENPSAVPIIGARTPEQLTDSAKAVDITLSDDQFDRITEAY
ncbi:MULTISPECIES: aldo/keto reductase [Natrialbaceae]|uniref:aldo/keto reductase n=1 Tax=Natrialbaceae TaxID=1644061 RepID=UPI00207CDFE6|nr:aldo/keto reductase [Natronococcus sp. CG52]